MKDTPHRFLTFEVPTHAPHFDRPEYRWTTIAGEFFAPALRHADVAGFVILNHEPKDVELRLASASYERVEERLAQRALTLGITRKPGKPKQETIGQALIGDRWLARDKQCDAEAASRRSELVFRFLHAGCELLMDNLVLEGPYWRIEPNSDAKDNPLGNSFESLLHLISNFSRAQFDVFLLPPPTSSVELLTGWMTLKAPVNAEVTLTGPLFPTPEKAARVRCHL